MLIPRRRLIAAVVVRATPLFPRAPRAAHVGPRKPPWFDAHVGSSDASRLEARLDCIRRASGSARFALRDCGRADQWSGSAPGSADGAPARPGPCAWGLGSFRLTPPERLACAVAPRLDVADHCLAAGLDRDVADRDRLRTAIPQPLKCEQAILE